MNWSKIKNIIILLLVLSNALLIFGRDGTVFSRERFDEGTITDVSEILAPSGISINPDLIPNEKNDYPVFTSAGIDERYYLTVAATLSGSSVRATNLTEDGAVIRLANNDLVRFSGFFDFEYTLSPTAETSALSDTPPASYYMNLLGSYHGFGRNMSGDRITFDVVSTVNNGSTVSVTCRQSIDAKPLYGFETVCEFAGDKLVSASGRWIFTSLASASSAQLSDQINILFSEKSYFDEHKIAERTVSSFAFSYIALYSENTESAVFCPGWVITYTDGSAAVYNAVNGERNEYKNRSQIGS